MEKAVPHLHFHPDLGLTAVKQITFLGKLRLIRGHIRRQLHKKGVSGESVLKLPQLLPDLLQTFPDHFNRPLPI